MKNLIVVWSNKDFSPVAADQMVARLRGLDRRAVLCYNLKTGLPSFANNAEDLGLVIIFVDSGEAGYPKVLEAISQTLTFRKEVPILLVKSVSPHGNYDDGFHLNGVFHSGQPDEELLVAIRQTSGIGIEELRASM